MPSNDRPIIIKKYANRRLYNTGSSTYVTLDDLAVMVKAGDEFVVVLPDIEDDSLAMAVADKIRDSLGQPFDLNEYQSHTISSSIGVAIYPDHGLTEIELTRHADHAMYRAKGSGRNAVMLFQPTSSILRR